MALPGVPDDEEEELHGTSGIRGVKGVSGGDLKHTGCDSGVVCDKDRLNDWKLRLGVTSDGDGTATPICNRW